MQKINYGSQTSSCFREKSESAMRFGGESQSHDDFFFMQFYDPIRIMIRWQTLHVLQSESESAEAKLIVPYI